MSNEIDYNELFGLNTGEGAEETEVTEPSGGEDEAGAEGAGVADPQVEDAPAPGGDEPAGEDEQQEQPGEQPPEERARYAAARRDAERQRDAAIAQAQARATAEVNAQIAAMNLINPYTNKPVTTMEEMKAFNDERMNRQKQEYMRKNNLTEEQYDAMVAQLPEVRAANEAMAKAEADQKAAREQQAKAALQEQVKKIGELDPTVRSIEDLAKAENYPEIYKLVQKGYDLADAYRLINFDRLTQRAAAAAQQQARNAARGKGHMTPTATRGSGGVEVPKDVAEQYRLYNPGITDAEIRAHWAKNHK